MNATTGQLVAPRVRRTHGKYAPLLALLRARHVSDSEVIWLERCFLFHTIGLSTCCDVVFLDKKQRVLRVLYSVPRNTFPVLCLGARTVIGMGWRALENTDVLVGDRFALEE